MCPTQPEQPLCRAIQAQGLVAQLPADNPHEHPLLVSNRLVQTTLRYLLKADSPTAEVLAGELRELAPRGLRTPPGRPLLHLCPHGAVPLRVRQRAILPGGPAVLRRQGGGGGGGGLEVAPDREVLSLVQLMTFALPAQAGSPTLRALMQTLVPLPGPHLPGGAFHP
ncbi:MAG: hypothetical protein FJY95_00365 [Candidatus Handelsmanbacteria bacterium]|nr:hypothetical protein [Candidatus Handelsmanbacteria bacterium]